ncbi:MAG: hypothetical protein JSV86_08865 [Gemmatimonadota bacterium]|nr:MAG: hypothetical protein JSV86_08865 [Gemmatimonadota bacterium]
MVDGLRRFDRRGARIVCWALLVVALALPWGTGAVVKIYLDLQGMPTYPWVYFVNPWTLVVYIIPSSIYWSSPLLALTALWQFTAGRERLLGLRRGQWLPIVLGGFVVGAAGAVRLYVPLFWDIQNSTVPAGRLPLLYLPYLLVGAALGGLLALARSRRRPRAARVPLM